MDVWHLIADRKIQEAMEEGAFENLEGAGWPIREDVNPYEDPAQRMTHRLLKNAGITPDWIGEGRDLDRDIDRIRADAQAGPEERNWRIAELNRRIAIFNLKTPVRGAQKLPVDLPD